MAQGTFGDRRNPFLLRLQEAEVGSLKVGWVLEGSNGAGTRWQVRLRWGGGYVALVAARRWKGGPGVALPAGLRW